MTYNIHICNPPSEDSTVRDLPAIARVIKEQNPDLVSLNEVDNSTTRSGIDINQARELGELAGMHWKFIPAMDRFGGQYGNGILSKLPILNSNTYPLPSTDEKVEPRSAGVATVEKEGQQFYFITVHLEHRDQSAQLLQARVLLDEIQSLDLPTIIAGDWNATPDSETTALFKKEFTPTYDDNKYPFTFSAIEPRKTIDYIMYKPAASFRTVDVHTINETYASDHFPVVAELELTF